MANDDSGKGPRELAAIPKRETVGETLAKLRAPEQTLRDLAERMQPLARTLRDLDQAFRSPPALRFLEDCNAIMRGVVAPTLGQVAARVDALYRSTAMESVRSVAETLQQVAPSAYLSGTLRAFAELPRELGGTGSVIAEFEKQLAAVAAPSAAILGANPDPALAVLAGLHAGAVVGALSWVEESQDEKADAPSILGMALREPAAGMSSPQRILIEADVRCDRCQDLILGGQQAVDLVASEMHIKLQLHVRPLCFRCMQELGKDYFQRLIERSSQPPYKLIDGGGENPTPTDRTRLTLVRADEELKPE